MKNMLKVIIGSVWTMTILYFFIKNHTYYQESLAFLPKIFMSVGGFMLSIAVVLGLQYAWKKIRKPENANKITITFVLAAATIAVATSVAITIAELNGGLSMYHGGTIFKDAESWGMLQEGAELEEGMEEIFVDGQLYGGDANTLIELLPEELQENFDHVNIIEGVLFAEKNIFMGLGFVLLMTIAVFSLGDKILKFFKLKAEGLERTLFSIAAGLGAYMLLFFILGALSLLQWWAVVGCYLIFTAISWREAEGLIKKIFSIEKEIEFSALKTFEFWVISAAMMVFMYNLIDIIRPIPVGWDDASAYLYIPERLSLEGGLFGSTGGIYNWELINLTGAYFNSAIYQLFINFWGGMLAVAGVYLLLSRFVTKKTATMLSAIFYMLPLVVFQSSTDLKTDLALLFFISLSVIGVVKWLEHEENGRSWLYMAGVLIGISLGIKITAGVALLALIVLLAVKAWGRIGAAGVALAIFGLLLMDFSSDNMFNFPERAMWITGVAIIIGGIAGMIIARKALKRNLVKEGAIFLIAVIAAMSPWAIKNHIIDGLPLNVGTYVAMNLNDAGIDFGDELADCGDMPTLGNEFATYITGAAIDQAISPWDLIKTPWQMTMNEGVNGLHVDISFLFLGMVPFILWGMLDHGNKKHIKLLFVFAAFYFVLIANFLGGIGWYAFIGLVVLLAIIGVMLEIYEQSDWKDEKMLSVIVKTALGIVAVMTVFVKIGLFGDIDQLAYLGGLLDDKDYINVRNPGVLETAEILSQESVGREDVIHIYKVGGATPYYLINTGADFVSDEALDTYACLASKYSDDELIEVFKSFDIKYFAIDYTQILKAESSSIYKQRMEDLLSFCAENMEALVARGDYVFYKIKD
ncbi:MAG: hypothetical protein ACD_51C00323G0001 [uncultured bacterium]|nr:MAG: hypothetical protein ACD_51C00323G0001 [uncultured bacterium]OGJ48190.1 MAG: hypothetical protein A2344_01125 [Candidatus Peregrinibacteria bacterium RIFOXYB12_FULL_41_12]OGJ48302.1 MAG: hypothetical protein A2244_02185 [Candidatus Peregrinibacteria bacterium RIFOXYA2_FULL_41_18]